MLLAGAVAASAGLVSHAAAEKEPRQRFHLVAGSDDGELPAPAPSKGAAAAKAAAAAASFATGSGGKPRNEEMSIPDAIERSMPALVKISVSKPVRTVFGVLEQGGSGSGFIIDGTGLIVTCYHVAAPGTKINVRMSDGTQYPAHVKGGDIHSDVSIVQIDEHAVKARGRPFPTLPLGSSAELRVGQSVVVLGAPLGLEQSASSGIVSSRVRHAPDFDMQVAYGSYAMLQVDAAMLPGNSGGPVINRRGEVVGISHMVTGQAGIGNSLNFAIPVDTAKPVIEGLRKYGAIRRNYLGLSIVPLTEAVIAHERALRRAHGSTAFPKDIAPGSGVLVTEVRPGSPAQKAGLREGDVVLRVNGKAIADVHDLIDGLGLFEPGKKSAFVIARGSTPPGGSSDAGASGIRSRLPGFLGGSGPVGGADHTTLEVEVEPIPLELTRAAMEQARSRGRSAGW